MTWVGTVFFVLGFVFLAKIFQLLEKNARVIVIARDAASIVRSEEMDDYQKEAKLQQYAKELFGLFLSTVALTLGAIAIPLGLIWLMELAGLLTVKGVLDTMLSLRFIAITILFSVLYFAYRSRNSG